MFTSIFDNGTNFTQIIIMLAASVVMGVLFAFAVSFKIRAAKGYFITLALVPVIVSLGIALVSKFLVDADTTGVARIATIAIALGLIRFRSINGTAEEMLLLLLSVVMGLIFGLGYLAYGVIFTIIFGLIYFVLASTPIFKNRRFAKEKLLKITIAENLNYTEIFDSIFDHYLKEVELVEVKTTGMGSMYRLSYKVILKNPSEEKEFLDELRVRNGNLEVLLQQYVDPRKQL